MIATLNLERGFEGESTSTCRFAERVQRIENIVSRCEVVDDKLVIKKLQEEIRVLRAELFKGNNITEELSGEELENVKARVDAYISGSVEELCYADYRKTKISFELMKSKISNTTPSGSSKSIVATVKPDATATSQIEHLKKLAQHRDNEISITI